MDAIFKRRSIREFLDRKIKEDDLKAIIKAGMNAPSAYNTRPWHFVIIEDKKILAKITKINVLAPMLLESSHAIAVCAEKKTKYWAQDAAAATENILLGATELGIGSCWIGVYPHHMEATIKKLLGIPYRTKLFSIVALGYAKEKKEANDFYEEEKVHYDKW